MARELAGADGGGRLTMLRTRPATTDDAAAIGAIYAHHARFGTATFDTDGHSDEIWRAKISDITARNWPFVIAADDRGLVGYAFATQFRDRPGYAQSCENSIYVHPDSVGQGVGRMLLLALLDAAAQAGFTQMIAVIGGDGAASVALHTSCGFRHAGRLENIGRKFGRLLDTVYMQRELAAAAR